MRNGLRPDLELHAEVHLLHHLLHPAGGPVIHEPGEGGEERIEGEEEYKRGWLLAEGLGSPTW